MPWARLNLHVFHFGVFRVCSMRTTTCSETPHRAPRPLRVLHKGCLYRARALRCPVASAQTQTKLPFKSGVVKSTSDLWKPWGSWFDSHRRGYYLYFFRRSVFFTSKMCSFQQVSGTYIAFMGQKPKAWIYSRTILHARSLRACMVPQRRALVGHNIFRSLWQLLAFLMFACHIRPIPLHCSTWEPVPA